MKDKTRRTAGGRAQQTARPAPPPDGFAPSLDRRARPRAWQTLAAIAALLALSLSLMALGRPAPAHAASQSQPEANVNPIVALAQSRLPAAHTASNANAARNGVKAPPTVQVSYSKLVSEIGARHVRTAVMHPRSLSVDVTLVGGGRQIAYFAPALEQELTNKLTAAGADLSIAATSARATSATGATGTLTLVMIVTGVLMLAIMVAAWVRFHKLAKDDGDQPAAPRHHGHLRALTRVREAAAVVPEVAFADVAGCDEAVEEVREMADFLGNPAYYLAVGAKMPAGILLYGPPGTGKTLLAKAVAGESGAPFFAMSGSDFTEVFVGAGAARVRDLFAKARAAAPAVVFIDEIDAVGKKRSTGVASNEEREGTLNQILVELDGFSEREHVLVIAATNRLDTLDEALLRPGRLARHVHVGLPTESGRLAILEVHASGKPLAQDVDLDALARSTAGSSGAQLAEMLNEGAIMAARERSATITHAHLWEGFMRVIAGPRKASAMLAAGERETIAFHEAGHVLCAELCETCDPTLHASIRPRGRAAGLAVIAQSDRALQDERYVHEQLIYILGGRAAEQVVNGMVSSGAANDLEKSNRIARAAVEQLGFSPLVGQITSPERGLSQELAALVDREVGRLVDEAYRDALELIEAHRPQLERLAQALIADADIDRARIVAAMRRDAATAPSAVERPGDRAARPLAAAPANALTPSRRGSRARRPIRGLIAAVSTIGSRRRAPGQPFGTSL